MLQILRSRSASCLHGRALKRSSLVIMRSLSSQPLTVHVAPDEVSAGRLTWQNLELAVRAIHRDGLVVLENIIEHDRLDNLNARMVEDARYLQSAGDASPFNYHKGNIQQDPPTTAKHFEPSIVLNPLATQVTSAVLGPRPRLSFVSGNSAMPPTSDAPPLSQPVHSDADFDHPNCPFALVVNVPLVEMTSENGSTEIWLGSHNLSTLTAQEGRQGERASGRIKSNLLEERRLERPPSQPVVRKGSIVIRDLRLWHAGKPNFTNSVRVMLAMIHFAPWFRNAMQVEFSEQLKSMLERHDDNLEIQRKLIPEQKIMEQYLHRGFGNSYNFDQQDRIAEAI